MDELRMLCRRLPRALGAAVQALAHAEAANLEEIRLYAGGDAEIVIGGAKAGCLCGYAGIACCAERSGALQLRKANGRRIYSA